MYLSKLTHPPINLMISLSGFGVSWQIVLSQGFQPTSSRDRQHQVPLPHSTECPWNCTELVALPHKSQQHVYSIEKVYCKIKGILHRAMNAQNVRWKKSNCKAASAVGRSAGLRVNRASISLMADLQPCPIVLWRSLWTRRLQSRGSRSLWKSCRDSTPGHVSGEMEPHLLTILRSTRLGQSPWNYLKYS